MDEGAGPDRRALLFALAGAGAAGLAGCTEVLDPTDRTQKSGDATEEPTERPPTETATPAETAIGTETASESAGSSPALTSTTFRHDGSRRAYAPEADPVGTPASRSWQREFGQAFTQPVVTESRVYLTGTGWSHDEPNVFAVSRSDGSQQWSYQAPLTAGPLTVDDGQVFLQTEPAVVAVDAQSGTEQWRTDVQAEDQHSVAVIDGLVVVAAESAGLVALARDTGERVWSTDIAPPDGGPATDGDHIFQRHGNPGSTVDVSVLDIEGGKERQTLTLPRMFEPPSVDGDLLVGGGFYAVTALDLQTGTERWSVDADDNVGQPALTDDHVVVAAETGEVYALDRASGERVWTADLDLRPRVPPVVADSTAYVGGATGDGGGVAVVDVTKGHHVGTLTTPKPVGSLPAVTDGGLVVATRDDVGGDDPETVTLFEDRS